MLCIALSIPTGLSARTDAISARDADVKTSFGGDVSRVGDVNGDGASDVLLADCGARDSRGELRVIFGPIRQGRLGDADFANGFSVIGSSRGDGACKIDYVGDVNADGFDDILVGIYRDYRDTESTKIAYLVFGKATTEPVSLRAFDEGAQGDAGFAILDSSGDSNWDGLLVAGAGDVNADGQTDILISDAAPGRSYIIFGRNETQPVDLGGFDHGTQGNEGFTVQARGARSSDLASAAGVGDVNGDGFEDVAIGEVHRLRGLGRVYVVFGKSDPGPVDVRQEPFFGFTIRGSKGTDTGASVSGIGDVNADGLDEVVVGAPSFYGRRKGRAFIIFGKKDTTRVDTTSLGATGVTILGIHRFDSVAQHVAGAGDVDGDAVPDLLLGGDVAFNGPLLSGAAFVVFGSADLPTTIKVSDLRDRGFRIDGIRRLARLSDVAGPGDVNGDGCDDILLGGYYYGSSRLFWGCRHL